MKGWQYMLSCPGQTQNLFTITLVYRHMKKSYKVHGVWYIHYGQILECPNAAAVYGLSLGKRVRAAEGIRRALAGRFEQGGEGKKKRAKTTEDGEGLGGDDVLDNKVMDKVLERVWARTLGRIHEKKKEEEEEGGEEEGDGGGGRWRWRCDNFGVCDACCL